MVERKTLKFTLDGDTIEVMCVYDAELGGYVHDYPDFKSTPRITPSGKPWVNVTMDDCPYADEEYGDCGSCQHFFCEKAGDQIGICNHAALMVMREKEMYV